MVRQYETLSTDLNHNNLKTNYLLNYKHLHTFINV